MDIQIVKKLIYDLMEYELKVACHEDCEIDLKNLLDQLIQNTQQNFGENIESWVDWLYKNSYVDSNNRETIKKMWEVYKKQIELMPKIKTKIKKITH